MRFNDLMATVLAMPSGTAGARATLWRQCADLLAQHDRGDEDAELDRIVAMMIDVRPTVDLGQRLGSVVELGSRLRSPRLMRVLAADEAPVMMAALGRARLADAAWPAIIASIGPLGRSVLRRRQDLSAVARRALDAFGATDLTLVDARPAEEQASRAEEAQRRPDASQIRTILARIERFTQERRDRRATPNADPDVPAPVQANPVARFGFRCDAAGVVIDVDGAPRTALVGISIAAAWTGGRDGPDGQMLGAFRRRGAFRDARLTLSDGALAGLWLIDGEPRFDAGSGRFTGYRAAARRSTTMEEAPRAPAAIDSATSLRQLIHELRTPLSGVMGFAELIENEMFGAVDTAYRAMAGDIVGEVHSLVAILEDLDCASRDDGRRPAGAAEVDAAVLLREAAARFRPDGAGQPGVMLNVGTALPPLDVAPAIAARMVDNLVRALAVCAGPDSLLLRCDAEGDAVVVTVDRPVSMRGVPAAALFEAGYDCGEGDRHAFPLGAGFSLRLVRKLARANAGDLAADADHIVLRLPAVRTAAREA